MDSRALYYMYKLVPGVAEYRWYLVSVFYGFVDDGISGLCFDRPSFLAMLKDIEEGNIGTVLIKDMSRLGRDYLIGNQDGFLMNKGKRQGKA